jgi:hypothetical protein
MMLSQTTVYLPLSFPLYLLLVLRAQRSLRKKT